MRPRRSRCWISRACRRPSSPSPPADEDHRRPFRAHLVAHRMRRKVKQRILLRITRLQRPLPTPRARPGHRPRRDAVRWRGSHAERAADARGAIPGEAPPYAWPHRRRRIGRAPDPRTRARSVGAGRAWCSRHCSHRVAEGATTSFIARRERRRVRSRSQCLERQLLQRTIGNHDQPASARRKAFEGAGEHVGVQTGRGGASDAALPREQSGEHRDDRSEVSAIGNAINRSAAGGQDQQPRAAAEIPLVGLPDAHLKRQQRLVLPPAPIGAHRVWRTTASRVCSHRHGDLPLGLARARFKLAERRQPRPPGFGAGSVGSMSVRCRPCDVLEQRAAARPRPGARGPAAAATDSTRRAANAPASAR